MSPAFARSACALALALLNLNWVAPAAAQDAVVALGHDETVRLALERQPQLEAQRAAVAAARDAAVAARQLPDPSLSFGIRELPLDGPDRYSLTRDSDTQLMLGIEQAWPLPSKRRARGARGEREREQAEAELAERVLNVSREAGRAWVDLWRYERALEIARAAVRETALQAEAAEIAYRASQAGQAELLAARVDLERMRDQAAGFEQSVAHARNALRRWIGEDALRPSSADLPAWNDPGSAEALLNFMHDHPHLGAARKRVEVAQADIALARQDYRPDLRIGVDYGHRREYSEMLSLSVGMDLPFFTGKRQDRRLAAALAQADRSEQLWQDDFRAHQAELRLNYDDWLRLRQRLDRFDRSILPAAQQRIEATRLAWQSGSGTLSEVLEARRAELELRMQRLDLQYDQARHQVELQYLSGAGHE